MPRPRKRARTLSTKAGVAPVSSARAAIDSSRVTLRDLIRSTPSSPVNSCTESEALLQRALHDVATRDTKRDPDNSDAASRAWRIRHRPLPSEGERSLRSDPRGERAAGASRPGLRRVLDDRGAPAPVPLRARARGRGGAELGQAGRRPRG